MTAAYSIWYQQQGKKGNFSLNIELRSERDLFKAQLCHNTNNFIEAHKSLGPQAAFLQVEILSDYEIMYVHAEAEDYKLETVKYFSAQWDYPGLEKFLKLSLCF